ncbi:taste receptor type 1 member 2-like [Clytia hemisphaerica]|uniref:taste receptor type 1 member 2-like n=1 Tax=Clytia hemisphaerica TaxID=252671 RepID=UPI0034D3AB75
MLPFLSQWSAVNHSLPLIHCKNITCPPGFYRTYGNTTMGFEWKCEPCPINYYSSTHGYETNCLPCLGVKSVSNTERIVCIDPYDEISFEMSSERYFGIVVCVIGIFSTLLTRFIFTLKRNTPIVKLSDYKLSLAHLVLICVNSVGVLISLMVQPINSDFCALKLVLISVGYTLNIAIVFIKSQKLLLAFLSTVRLTSNEIKRSIGLQIFNVFMFLIFINGALLIAVAKKPIEMIVIRDDLSQTKQSICNTYSHTSLTMGLSMILQLLCCIQVYRGRHLPSVMNDGIVLMYTTLALVVCFGANFAMVYFQKSIDKELFQLNAVAVNVLIITFLLYGQKAVRMLFLPERNTAQYFQEQRLVEMRQRTNDPLLDVNPPLII